MAPSSLSSLYLSAHQANPFPSLNPKPTFARLPLRPQTLAFSSKPSTQSQNQSQNETQNQNQTQKLNSPQPDKKSFAIATGELFLGIASRLIKSSNNKKAASAGSETGFPGDGPNRASVSGGGRGAGYDSKERIGVVIEDEIEPDVIWEQRIKDVEAEQKRRVVTSPGFSFSAAGLLFPYHLGVAQFLIEKGYIKVFPTNTCKTKFLGQIEELVIGSCEDMELTAGPEKCEKATEFPSLEVFRRASCGTEPDQSFGEIE